MSSKEELDSYLKRELYNAFEEIRIVLAGEIAKQREMEAARKAEQEKQDQERRKRNKTIIAIVTPIIAVAIIFVIVLNTVIIPGSKYNKAIELFNDGDYNAALDAFSTIADYKDSANQILECKCAIAIGLYNEGNYGDAKNLLLSIQDYENANKLIGDCYMQMGDYQSAISAYGTTDIVIPDGITHIKTEAFKGCDTLTSITIPTSVTSIGSGAFDDCENLVDVHISDLTKWCQIQFEDLTSSPMHYGDNLYLNGEILTDVIVPDSLTHINEYAFTSWDCLVSIVIGNNITSIDAWAFAFCNNLKSVTLPNSITSINESIFNDCSSLTEITIPASVESIGEDAFYNCNALTDVKIPDNVETIGKGAFGHCDNLSTFSFPAGIKKVEGYMFYPCDTLETVVIPNSVTSIGKWAFRECPELATIRFNGTISEWKSITKEDEWDYEIGNYIVYCTDGQISAAQNAIYECKAGDVITFGTYEQDNNLDNGAEAIDWIVLERDGDKALVISKYCLEQMPFNNTLAPVTWENCTIRKWLNNDFLNKAFSAEEKISILISNVSYPDDVDHEEPAKTTQDRIFLLSENEALMYFDSDSERAARTTEYVGALHCYWILRTNGSVSNVAHVDTSGYVGYYENVDREWYIRPAMWIEIVE